MATVTLTSATLTPPPAGDLTNTNGILTITLTIKAGEETPWVARDILEKVTLLAQ